MNPPDASHDFWEASGLSSFVFDAFVFRLTAYDAEGVRRPDPLAVNAPIEPLPSKNDRLQRLFEKRRSTRSFSRSPLEAGDLGTVLAAVGAVDAERRVIPSAGGLGTVEVYVVCERVEGRRREVVRYYPHHHGIAHVSDLPTRAEVDRLCATEGNDPAIVLLLAVRFDEIWGKYGERGTRFALIEVGHACQNIALRIARAGLAGYQLGGVHDLELEQLCRLGPGRARITLGYAVGHPS